jgi:predicted MFS family arabinose efflux permease
MVSSTIVIGLGSTMLNISLVNIVIFSVERSSLGTAAGLNTVFRNLGSTWGPAVAGTIMDQFKDTLLLLTSPYIDSSTISLCISINILSHSITIHHTSYCA